MPQTLEDRAVEFELTSEQKAEEVEIPEEISAGPFDYRLKYTDEYYEEYISNFEQNTKKRYFYRFVKRTFDIFASFIGLLIALPLFLVISFGVASVFSFMMAYITRPKNNNVEPKNKIFSNKALVLFLVAGLGTAFNHSINLYLSGAMESAVFFPIMSGGELILVTLSSVIIFKEKLSYKQWIGLVCGIAAVIILCF